MTVKLVLFEVKSFAGCKWMHGPLYSDTLVAIVRQMKIALGNIGKSFTSGSTR